MRKLAIITAFLLCGFTAISQMKLLHTIKGRITPKSVVHNGNGLFFAQNMIYSHTITVYDKDYNLIKTIPDRINLKQWGFDGGSVKGGPVEAAFSHNGKFAWVSNYTMEGKGFENPGCDNCNGSKYDPGYIYKINTQTLKIENVIKAGAVPKFIAVSPNDKYVLVSNWTSGDISVISTRSDSVIQTIKIGAHPRGIVVDSKSSIAYITIMGSDKIAVVSLKDFNLSYIREVGRAPRHLCISPDDRCLYCSINNLGKLIKIDLQTNSILSEVQTGRAPRSMEISPDGKYLYVVNYKSNTFSKVRTSDMMELGEVSTKSNPIGITLNWPKKEIWVACYSGCIQVFEDTTLETDEIIPDLIASMDENMSLIASNLIDPEPVSVIDTSDNQPEPKEETTPKSSIEIAEADDLAENNYLPNTYIIVGSFSIKSNAINYSGKLKGQGYEVKTIPSQKAGFTYTAIRIKENPTVELNKIKRDIISSAWIYRP